MIPPRPTIIPPRPLKPFYDDGKGIVIYCGDNRIILPQLKFDEFDLLLTDPPYGIGAGEMNFTSGTNTKRKQQAISNSASTNGDWDKSPPSPEFMSKLFNRPGNNIIWGGNYYNPPPSRCWLIWDKIAQVDNYADAELAWTNFDAVVQMFTKKWAGAHAKEKHETRVHPTQKSVALMNWCIQLSEKKTPTNTIIDPFMGSGTTLVAAKMMGKKCVGIEQELSYCQTAVERLQQNYLL